MDARPLRGGIGAVRLPLRAAAVRHRPRRVVHRAEDGAREGDGAVVRREVVVLREAELHQLKAVDAFHANEVGVRRLQAGRLAAAVEVHDEAVPRRRRERVFHESRHLGVVALHEVDLESAYAAPRERAEDLVLASVDRPPRRPEDHAHAARGRVAERFVEVEPGRGREEVVADLPALVDHHPSQPELRREVDVRLVGRGVDARPERHALQMPVAPPLPGARPGPHPRIVAGWRRRQVARDRLPHQPGRRVGDREHAPRKRAPPVRLHDPAVPLRHAAVVARGLDFHFAHGELAEHAVEPPRFASVAPQVPSGVVAQVGLGDKHRRAVRTADGHRQIGDAAAVRRERRRRGARVDGGASVLELVLLRVVRPVAPVVADPELRVGRGKDERGRLVDHRDLAVFVGREAVRHAVVPRRQLHARRASVEEERGRLRTEYRAPVPRHGDAAAVERDGVASVGRNRVLPAQRRERRQAGQCQNFQCHFRRLQSI